MHRRDGTTAVDEPRRVELFERLRDLVGAEATHTLFEALTAIAALALG